MKPALTAVLEPVLSHARRARVDSGRPLEHVAESLLIRGKMEVLIGEADLGDAVGHPVNITVQACMRPHQLEGGRGYQWVGRGGHAGQPSPCSSDAIKTREHIESANANANTTHHGIALIALLYATHLRASASAH